MRVVTEKCLQRAQRNLHSPNSTMICSKKLFATGNLVGLENFKIASEKHQLQTVCLNKIALSAYDDKRYINGDRTTTLPFGHFSLRDEYLTKKICEDSAWGVESDEDINVFNIPEGGEASGWETPDPGFNQLSYSNEELDNVADLSNLSELSDETDQETPNPFVLTEAEEDQRAITTPSTSDDHLPLSIVKQRKQKNIRIDESRSENNQSNSKKLRKKY